MKLSKLNRDVHRWGSILIALPVAVIIVTGVILQLKKESAWIQPTTKEGSSGVLSVSFDEILVAAQSVPEANVEGFDRVVQDGDFKSVLQILLRDMRTNESGSAGDEYPIGHSAP